MAMPIFVNTWDTTDQPAFTTFWNNMTPVQQANFITYARDVYPANGVVVTTTTQGDPIFSPMQAPLDQYGNSLYSTLSTKDQTGFVDYLKGFTPHQRELIVRELYTYSTSNEKKFMADATADMAYPVLRSIAEDKNAFDALWNSMTTAQKTDFIVYARDFYHASPVMTTPMTTTTTVTTVTTPQGTEIFTTMPPPVDQYGNTIYTTIPVSDQPGFITYLNSFTPDQRVMIVKSLHYYSMAPNLTPFTTDITPSAAYTVINGAVMPEDQASFSTLWNSMTPEQQNSYIMYARDIYPNSSMNTNTTTTTTPPTTTTTTTTTTNESAGTAAQPFGITMAAAFVGFLPEAERGAYNAIAGDTPVSELGGMNNVLASLTPEQAGMIVHALASINSMGKSGAKPKQGMSDQNVKQLYMSQLTDADKTNFESMWNGLNDQQRSSLEQLCRDAFNGGMNDTGMPANSMPSGNGS